MGMRESLLSVNGVGPETADSICLYAARRPVFVVDAYTQRILIHLGVISNGQSYTDTQQLFESSLEPDLRIFQEYHALLVAHGKIHYSRKPYGINDTLLSGPTT